MKAYVITPRQAVLRAGASAGVQVVPVCGEGDLGDLGNEAAAPVLVNDPLNPVHVCRAILEHGVAVGDEDSICVGFGDDSSQVAAIVNSQLNLANSHCSSFQSLETMRDKSRLRSLLGADSRMNVEFGIAGSMNELHALIEGIGRPVVVKPTAGSGSRDVIKVLEGDVVSGFDDSDFPLLVEECLTGEEFSVEMLSWNGSHIPLVITKKILGGETGLVEIGHRQPAQIDSWTAQSLFSASSDVLTIAGYDFGLSHCEFVLTDTAPRLIEAHGRVGGDGIADMMESSLGKSGFELLFEVLEHGSLVDRYSPSGRAAVDFVNLSDIRCTDAEWIERVESIAGVESVNMLKDRGSRGEVYTSSDRHASVLSSGPVSWEVWKEFASLED